MAIVAMIILGVLIFLLTGSGTLFSSKATIYTYMGDSGGMAGSSPVRLNGILVGDLDSVELSGLRDPRRVVRIRMRIEQNSLKEIPADSIAGISASNLLGDKFINITKGTSPNPVKDGGELQSLEPRDIPELMTQSANMLADFQKVIKRVDDMLADVQAGKGNVGKLLRDEALYEKVNSTMDEAQKLVFTMRSGTGTFARLLNDDALYQDVRTSIRKIDDLMAGLQRGEGTAGKLLKDPALFDDTRKTVAEIRRMIDDLNAGKGTAGKLLKDEQLYRQINQLVARLDTTLDKVNTGQGTLGQLVVNPQLYESMNGVTRELNTLLKEIRANPKKFLRIKLGLF